MAHGSISDAKCTISFNITHMQLIPGEKCPEKFWKILRNTSTVDFHEKHFLLLFYIGFACEGQFSTTSNFPKSSLLSQEWTKQNLPQSTFLNDKKMSWYIMRIMEV